MKDEYKEVVDDYDFDDYYFYDEDDEEYWNHRQAMDGLYNAWEIAGF